ncbi:hypothetical protein AV530_012591 [Patagioenas fasciata monilis]|uniref:Uncharacterized protein n=1 Tax=Patagioenas fasciata monilis TaxID=372326 RepID=A0A1V4JBE9_PATFA|nr:hypothetical protein AV530_012591 [Patagioenas fasciata monilis]
MFKYLDTIRKLHATYGGTSWMSYDEDFRRRAAKDPTLPWGDVDLDLWMNHHRQGPRAPRRRRKARLHENRRPVGMAVRLASLRWCLSGALVF